MKALSPRLVGISFFSLIGLVVAPALAQQPIVIRTFDGPHGAKAQERLVRVLKQRYTLLPEADLQGACQVMGKEIKPGAELAQCAQAIGATAVITGTAKKKKLDLAVYSGVTGETLAGDSVDWAPNPRKRHMRGALKVIMGGLEKAPRDPPPATATAGAVIGSEMSFAPEAVDRSDSNQTGDGTTAPIGEDTENPFAPPKLGAQLRTALEEPPEPEKEDEYPPQVSGSLGLGIWKRSFEPENPQPAPGVQHPTHDVGAALALRVMGEVRPGAFFTDSAWADVFARFRFTTTLGLKSNVTLPPDQSDSEPTESIGTTMMELLLDVGYDWNILDTLLGPHLRGSVGFGFNDFSFSWGTVNPAIPDIFYPYVFLNAGVIYPFASMLDNLLLLAVRARFDYRFVFSAGDIENADWYGPASTNGLAFGGGLDIRIADFIVALEYIHTRFSLSFDANHPGPRIADGASDIQNTLMVTVGYSY